MAVEDEARWRIIHNLFFVSNEAQREITVITNEGGHLAFAQLSKHLYSSQRASRSEGLG